MVWQYLNSQEALEVKMGYLSSQREPWYRQEKRSRPEILLTYMGRESIHSHNPFKFFLNRSQAICTNSYLLMSIKTDAPEIWKKENWQKKLVQYLNSLDGKYFFHYGRVYGGGLFKLEPKELAQLPLPEFLLSGEKIFKPAKQAALLF
jgi:hypothetical protein